MASWRLGVVCALQRRHHGRVAQILDGYVVLLHFRGKVLGLRAEVFGLCRGNECHAFLVLGDSGAAGLLCADGFDARFQVRGVRPDVAGIDA